MPETLTKEQLALLRHMAEHGHVYPALYSSLTYTLALERLVESGLAERDTHFQQVLLTAAGRAALAAVAAT